MGFIDKNGKNLVSFYKDNSFEITSSDEMKVKAV